MEWTEEGIVLCARRHGESSAIVSLLTREQGRHAGLVRGGFGRAQRGLLEPGNRVRAYWRARLAEHLGTLTCEPIDSNAAALLDDPLRLAALSAATSVADAALPEREPHARVHDGLLALLALLCGAAPIEAWGQAHAGWERDLLADLRPAGARFRSFLLHTLKNHLASEWTRAHAGKRAGTSAILSWDDLSPEARYSQEAADAESPDAAFDRRWANTVLQQALDRLRQEHVAAGKEILFDVLADGLTGAAPSQPYAELAMKLGMTEGAVKMAIHRLRKRYGELLRLEVAQTVVTSAEIDQELRHLLSALAAH